MSDQQGEDDDVAMTVTSGRRRAAAPVDALPGEATVASAPGRSAASDAAAPVPPAVPAAAPAAVPAPAAVVASVPAPSAAPLADAGLLPPMPTGAASAAARASFATAAPAAAGSSRLGWEPGAPRLYETWGEASTASKRPLGSEIGVLPELEEREEKKRPLWRHPAFIVSAILTLLAIGVGGTLMVISLTSAGPPTVSKLSIAAGSGNVRLTWSGPDVPYDLYVTDADGTSAVDLTQLVRGREAWVPRAAQLFTDDSCFVVRAAESSPGAAVSTDPDELSAQGAQSVCVADAG